MAEAWHHRSDAMSSVGAFIGILGARMGYPILDPIASLVICVMILYAAYEVFKDSMDKMVDRSCDEETATAMEELVSRVPGVCAASLGRYVAFPRADIELHSYLQVVGVYPRISEYQFRDGCVVLSRKAIQ